MSNTTPIIPDDQTASGLLAALKASGNVYTRIDGSARAFRLHKTEFISSLRELPKDYPISFYYREDRWTNPYGSEKFERDIYVGRRA